jgi:hypothetical protein
LLNAIERTRKGKLSAGFGTLLHFLVAPRFKVSNVFDGDARQVHLTKKLDEVAFDDLYIVFVDALGCAVLYFLPHIGNTDFGNICELTQQGRQALPFPKPRLVIPVASNTHRIVQVALAGTESDPLTTEQMETSLP